MAHFLKLLLVFTVISIEIQSASAAPTLRERLAKHSVAGHRGSGLGVNSNTLEGFEQARRDGVDIIETDLRLTRDGVPVISHDAKLPFAGHGVGRIAEMTLAEVKTCKLAGGRSVPSLEEVLKWSDGRVVINAEFKVKEVILPALALLRQYDAYEWVYFQSQSDQERYRIARTADSRVALLFKANDAAALDWALGQNDDRLLVIEVDGAMRRSDVVARVHAAGKLVSANAWRYGLTGELIRDHCGGVYEDGIDIAVTNRNCGCAEAASLWNRNPPASFYAKASAAMIVPWPVSISGGVFGLAILLAAYLRFTVWMRVRQAARKLLVGQI